MNQQQIKEMSIPSDVQRILTRYAHIIRDIEHTQDGITLYWNAGVEYPSIPDGRAVGVMRELEDLSSVDHITGMNWYAFVRFTR
jgi:hypothetical protein